MSTFFTICKFIPNNTLNVTSLAKYPLLSRSLGKVALPVHGLKLNTIQHKDTFWVVEVLHESDIGNKGVIEVAPLYMVSPVPLIPGLFDTTYEGHWVFLQLKEDVPIRPYFVPKTLKQEFLNPERGQYAACCIPYPSGMLSSIPPAN